MITVGTRGILFIAAYKKKEIEKYQESEKKGKAHVTD